MIEVVIGISLFFLALFVYSFNLNHGLYVDELYHLLPAHSVLVDGTLRVAEGEYVRVELYTRFVAFLFGIFGESVEVARISSAVIVGVFISTVFFAVSWMVGRTEALLTALVLVVLPSSIYIAQFIRFYALHQLVFFIGALGVYVLITTRLSVLKRSSVLVLTSSAIAFSCYLQKSSLIALMGVFLWVILYLTSQILNAATRTRQHIWALIFLLSGCLIFLLVLIVQDVASSLITSFRWTAPWNAGNTDNYLYYHRLLRYQFSSLWSFFPVACILAILKKPKQASFFACIFIVSLVVFSLGGMKAERYVVFLYPFFVGILAIVAVPMFSTLRALIIDGFSSLSYLNLSLRSKKNAANLLLLIVCSFIVLSNHAISTAFHILNGQQYYHEIGDWSLSRKTVEPLVNNANIVLTTNDVESLYYFKRYDYVFSSFRLNEAAGKTVDEFTEEFTVDPRTGLPIISKLDSLELLINCYSNGVFLGDSTKWHKDGLGLGEKGVDLLSKYATRIDTNSRSLLVAFSWQNKTLLPEKECKRFYQFKRNSEGRGYKG